MTEAARQALKLSRHGAGPEIFLSLQGEGKHQGRPSVFVRTSRCNLYCEFCDTPYTWNWSDAAFSHRSPQTYDRAKETIELSISQVVERASRFGCPTLVLTGGEPLLQASAGAALAQAWRQRGPRRRVEIETNGTLIPPEELVRAVDLFTVSPKLSHAQVPKNLRLRQAALEFFARHPRAVFKFVVRDAEDESEVQALAHDHDIPPDRIFLMPEALDVATLDRRRRGVAQLALANGYRYSDRLQLTLYGNERGT